MQVLTKWMCRLLVLLFVVIGTTDNIRKERKYNCNCTVSLQQVTGQLIIGTSPVKGYGQSSIIPRGASSMVSDARQAE